MAAYITLTLAWVFFFATHSITASTRAKNGAVKLHAGSNAWYRLAFNTLSVASLIPAVFIYFTLPAKLMFTTSLWHEITGTLLTLAGVYILIAGFKNYRTDEFLGLYQLKNHHEFHPGKLSREGWNGVVRHPLYFGGLVLMAGLFLLFPTEKLGVTIILITTYLYIGSLWEEKKLIDEFGDDYRQYKQEVSMLVPLKWLMDKLRK